MINYYFNPENKIGFKTSIGVNSFFGKIKRTVYQTENPYRIFGEESEITKRTAMSAKYIPDRKNRQKLEI